MSNDLMQRLAISKAIMDKHNNIQRGNASPLSNIEPISRPEVQNFDAPIANYNIPQEFLSESESQSIPKTNKPISKDLIMNSKLPDEIKKLMIENPITPHNPMVNSSSVLSEELIQKATKLMGTTKPTSQPNTSINQPINPDLKSMLKEVVKEVLKENGLISETVSKSSDTIHIKVGQHIFEGKISKIKKVS
jgi:hypothetical protein